MLTGNKIQTVRTDHTITAGEEAAGFATFPILFGTPFRDTNYTVVATITEHDPPAAGLQVVMLHVHSKTTTGFTAHVLASAGTTGENVTLDIIAIGD